MKNFEKKGVLNGIFASVSYGTNPLFALPLYSMGMNVNSVLLYRYLFGMLIYGFWLKFYKKINFSLSLIEFLCLYVMAILFALSSLTLFESFKYLASGIACTILFVYPIIVALLAFVFFKEKITKYTIGAIILCLTGIYLLNGGIHANLNLVGVIWVILSALSYAVYIILVKYLPPVKKIHYDKMSFYVMLFGLSLFIVNSKFGLNLYPVSDIKMLVCTLGLALFPTIISLETINIAIRIIGSTKTAVLGALEPLTAFIIGVLIFNETITFQIIAGVFLILAGVILVISKNKTEV